MMYSNEHRLKTSSDLFDMCVKLMPSTLFLASAVGAGKTTFTLQLLLKLLEECPFIDDSNKKKKMTVGILRSVKDSSDSTVVESIRKHYRTDIKQGKDHFYIELEIRDQKTGEVYTSKMLFYLLSGWGKGAGGKMSGTEFTVIWIEEAQEVGIDVYSHAMGRVGRELLPASCNKKDHDEHSSLGHRRRELNNLTQEEEDRYFEIDDKYNAPCMIILTFNTDLNERSQWLYEEYLKAQNSKGIDWQSLPKPRRLERLNKLFIRLPTLLDKIPFFNSRNTDNVTEGYKTRLEDMPEYLKISKVLGEFTLKGAKEVVFGDVFVDNVHVIDRIFDYGVGKEGKHYKKPAVSTSFIFEGREAYDGNIRIEGKVTEDIIMDVIRYSPATDIILGLDFRFHPALVVLAKVYINNMVFLRVIDELVFPEGVRIGEKQFAKSVYDYMCKNNLYMDLTPTKKRYKAFGDPSGKSKSPSLVDQRALFRHYGINLNLECSNDPEKRVISVQTLLTARHENQDDQPAFFALYENCRKLIHGFRGGYVYMPLRKDINGEYIDEKQKIQKNDCSHSQDALQYACERIAKQINNGTFSVFNGHYHNLREV